MRISRIELKNWKNFKSASVDLGQRAFFIGPNASGKSNLFDAVLFLRDLAASGGGGLQAAVAIRRGMPAIRTLHATQPAHVQIALDLADNEQVHWRYQVEFTSTGTKGRKLRLRREVVHLLPALSDPLPILDRPDDADREDEERLTETALEQTSANQKFRAIAEFLRSVRYLHIVPQIIREPARIPDPIGDPYGGDLLARIHACPERSRKKRLRLMAEALKIAVPQFAGLELQVDEAGQPHLVAKYVHWRTHGAFQDESQFSDGTLRLLGLIWSLQERGGPLLIEEPELSLHADVVTQLPQMIAKAARKSGRQVLISTHSPDLLAAPSIGLDEIFLLEPGEQGTTIVPATTIEGAWAMLAKGIPLPEIVLPKSRPKDAERLGQLSLF
jgi:predicted ATPase